MYCLMLAALRRVRDWSESARYEREINSELQRQTHVDLFHYVFALLRKKKEQHTC